MINFCPTCGTPLIRAERFGQVRPTCPACGYVHFHNPKVAAGVFVTRDTPQGPQVLLIQRGAEADAPGWWALPAGFVDGSEDPARTAQREAAEETGLHVTITGLLGVFHSTAGRASIVIIYSAAVAGGSLRAGDDAAAACWFPPGALPPLAFLSTQTLVSQWAQAAGGADSGPPGG